MKTLKVILCLLVLIGAGGAAFVYSGSYEIGADVPHTPAVYAILETLRDRSVEKHAAGIQVPPLDDPKLIAEGAEHYAAMCTGCHLAPGLDDSEIRPGLYPQPPELYKQNGASPAEQFWVIKHGLKLTAMPAWGPTHDDQAIWGMVAFLQKLPGLSPQAYAALTADPAEGSEHSGHHDGVTGHDPTSPEHQH